MAGAAGAGAAGACGVAGAVEGVVVSVPGEGAVWPGVCGINGFHGEGGVCGKVAFGVLGVTGEFGWPGCVAGVRGDVVGFKAVPFGEFVAPGDNPEGAPGKILPPP